MNAKNVCNIRNLTQCHSCLLTSIGSHLRIIKHDKQTWTKLWPRYFLITQTSKQINAT